MMAFRYICMCSSDKEIYSVCMDYRTVEERVTDYVRHGPVPVSPSHKK
jgi:hypothetical protein